MTVQLRHILIALLFLGHSVMAEDRALIIGIESYPNLDLRLAPQSAAEDAIAMAELSVTQWGYAQTQVSVLINEAASSDAILNALIDELVGLTGPGDRALLYFAGVGSRNSAGKRVLLANDSESLLGRIPEDAISDILDLIADRQVTVIIDAGFRGDINTPGQRGVGAPGFEATPFAANGELRAVYAASAISQTAWETAAGGVFTRALVDSFEAGMTHGDLITLLRRDSNRWCESNPDCAQMGLNPDFAGPISGSPATTAIAAQPAPIPTPAPTPTPTGDQSAAGLVDNLFTSSNAAGLQLAVDGGTQLTIGQSVTFRARANASGTLVILDIGPTGELAQVFPSALAPASGTKIVAGQELSIPAGQSSNGAPLRVRVTGPAGSGLLLGLLIEDNLPDLTAVLPQNLSGGSVNDATQYLIDIALDLERTRPGGWSATTLPYTISN